MFIELYSIESKRNIKVCVCDWCGVKALGENGIRYAFDPETGVPKWWKVKGEGAVIDRTHFCSNKCAVQYRLHGKLLT